MCVYVEDASFYIWKVIQTENEMFDAEREREERESLCARDMRYDVVVLVWGLK